MKTHTSHKPVKALLIGIVMIAAATIWGILRMTTPEPDIVNGADNAARIAFINSCGWKTGAKHTDSESIKIPIKFDEIYSTYNDIQLRQGFDLRPYRSKYVRKYTYPLENYLSDSGQPLPHMYAHLLVWDDEIIAADISSAEENGLITVLVPPDKA